MAINLLNWRYQQSRLQTRFCVWVVFLLMLGLTGCAILYRRHILQQTSQYEKKAAVIVQHLNPLNAKIQTNNVETNYLATQNLLNIISQQLAKQSVRLALLETLPAKLPAHIKITHLNMSTDSMVLNGSGESASIAKLLTALSKLPYLTQVNVAQLSRNEFSIHSTIKYPESHEPK